MMRLVHCSPSRRTAENSEEKLYTQRFSACAGWKELFALLWLPPSNTEVHMSTPGDTTLFAVATWSTKNSRYIHTYIHAIVKTSCWFESTWINIWGRAAANLQRLRTRVCCCKLAKMNQGLGLARWAAKCCISEIVNQTRKNLTIST